MKFEIYLSTTWNAIMWASKSNVSDANGVNDVSAWGSEPGSFLRYGFGKQVRFLTTDDTDNTD